MCRCRMGNPKKQSRFICLKHCGENHILDGLQRGGHQREKKHIKDAFCIICQETVKNLEVRYCDNYQEMMDKSEELHREYYGDLKGENNMYLKDLINVIPNFTIGKIRDKNGNVICEGELFTDYDPNFSEEYLERKVAMVMVDDGKLLIVVE